MSKPLCVLVDDERPSLSALKDAIEEIGLLEIENSFLNPDKFLTQVDQLKSDIIFLKSREGERYASALTKMSQNNRIIQKFGKIKRKIFHKKRILKKYLLMRSMMLLNLIKV